MTEQEQNKTQIIKNVMVLMPFRSGDINGEKNHF